MSDQTTLLDSPSAISSLASESGLMHSDSPAGQMINQSGQGRARANLSARQAKELGLADERHLWPAWFHLIEECRPDELFGEQVASPDGREWFDLVRTDMEGTGYACGPVNLCAAGVGAPHIRQRLWWVAQSGRQRREGKRLRLLARRPFAPVPEAWRGGETRELGHSNYTRPQGWSERRISADQLPAGTPSLASTFWSGADWIYCRDEKWRPVEPGTFPLAHGAAERVGRLRGYGDAIVAQAAAEMIRAAMLIG